MGGWVEICAHAHNVWPLCWCWQNGGVHPKASCLCLATWKTRSGRQIQDRCWEARCNQHYLQNKARKQVEPALCLYTPLPRPLDSATSPPSTSTAIAKMSAAEKEMEVQESEMKFVDRGLTPTPPGEKNDGALRSGVVEASVEVKWAYIKLIVTVCLSY